MEYIEGVPWRKWARPISPRAAKPTQPLRRLVDGDLTWITMKALEKVRQRRYASVAKFAADIQKHIEERPVLASALGMLYRTRKFLRRHRAGGFRYSRRARVHPVERINGLVVRAPRFSAETQVN
jgi:hypothetical protein